MTELASARRLHRSQRRLSLAAEFSARAAWRTRNLRPLVTTVAALQGVAARLADATVSEMVAEQDLVAPAEASVVAEAFAGRASDGRPLLTLFEHAKSPNSLVTMASTQVADAGRVATGVATVARPALDGHVRHVVLPSCSRCVILAGRFYRYSQGFQRHPRCDCLMVPTTEAASPDLVSDPMEAFRAGQVTGLSKADAQAIAEGADLAQVVNIRRRQTGLSIAGRVVQRGQRPTPEGIYLVSSSREQALELLARHGYIS